MKEEHKGNNAVKSSTVMLPKNADSIVVVGEMLGSDFTEIVRNSRDSALQKWEMRKNRIGKGISSP